MGIAAALTLQLENLNAQKNFFQQQEIFWAGKYEANSAKLSIQVGYEGKFNEAYDSAINNEKAVKCGGVVVSENNTSKRLAEKYAHAKVEKYKEEISAELAAKDIEYDNMKTMYEAMLEQINAQIDSTKSAAQQAAGDTGLLQS